MPEHRPGHRPHLLRHGARRPRSHDLLGHRVDERAATRAGSARPTPRGSRPRPVLPPAGNVVAGSSQSSASVTASLDRAPLRGRRRRVAARGGRLAGDVAGQVPVDRAALVRQQLAEPLERRAHVDLAAGAEQCGERVRGVVARAPRRRLAGRIRTAGRSRGHLGQDGPPTEGHRFHHGLRWQCFGGRRFGGRRFGGRGSESGAAPRSAAGPLSAVTAAAGGAAGSLDGSLSAQRGRRPLARRRLTVVVRRRRLRRRTAALRAGLAADDQVDRVLALDPDPYRGEVLTRGGAGGRGRAPAGLLAHLPAPTWSCTRWSPTSPGPARAAVAGRGSPRPRAEYDRLVAGARTVLTAAAAAGVGRAVLVTSAMVYGASADNPVPPRRGRASCAAVADGPAVSGAAGGRGARRARVAAVHPGSTSPCVRPAVLVGAGRDSAVHPALRGPAAARRQGLLAALAVLPRRGPRDRARAGGDRRRRGRRRWPARATSTQDEVEGVTGMRRIELPARIAYGTADRLHRLGVTPAPASELASRPSRGSSRAPAAAAGWLARATTTARRSPRWSRRRAAARPAAAGSGATRRWVRRVRRSPCSAPRRWSGRSAGSAAAADRLRLGPDMDVRYRYGSWSCAPARSRWTRCWPRSATRRSAARRCSSGLSATTTPAEASSDAGVQRAHLGRAAALRAVAERALRRRASCRRRSAPGRRCFAVGDLAVVVAAGRPAPRGGVRGRPAAHRHLKHEVPIWKHQRFSDGSQEWVAARVTAGLTGPGPLRRGGSLDGMQAMAWWSVPLVAFVLAIVWVSLANRPRPPADPHDSVAEHQRFRRRWALVDREADPAGRSCGRRRPRRARPPDGSRAWPPPGP